MRTGELGFWWHSLGGPPTPRSPLSGSEEADVAIVGAGYTGLWAAYYLTRADPRLRIVLLEREIAGFGASGRNGGWVSGFSGPPRVYARRRGPKGYAALQRAMIETVDEVARVIAQHGIEADFLKAGQLSVALNEPQASRLSEHVREARRVGLAEGDLQALTPEQLAARVAVRGAGPSRPTSRVCIPSSSYAGSPRRWRGWA
jgi:glycine/D-amino acid oxidase-like deaminating enzyme